MSFDITVLLPVYNGEQYIAEAVTSILAQTYTNFELLIMDDGSTDGTPQVLEPLAARDKRVRIHRRENRGLIATLNEGLAMCCTELVARMDADDLAMPERLALQKKFMDGRPHIAVCGTGLEMYESGKVMTPRCNAPFDILCLFASPLAHPTVMYRRSAVLDMGGYAFDMPAAEDYDLWCRMAAAGHGIDNLPQSLLRYRMHPNAPRVEYRTTARETTARIWARQLHALGLSPTPSDIDLHGYCAAPCVDAAFRIDAATTWLNTLCEQNRFACVYDQALLEQECAAIKQHFPQPISMVKNPVSIITRLLRHVVMAFCHNSGQIGRSIEGLAHSWGHRIRIFLGKG